MFKSTQILPRWLTALLIMLIIFLFSAHSSSNLPDFAWADGAVKKGGHMIGYAILAFSYWRAFDFDENKRWLCWLLAVLYGVTDELHQSFVPGRHPSLWDVILFDNFGALLSLWLATGFEKRKRPDSIHPIVEDASR